MTLVVIQARLGSRRFPRKVLAPLVDRPVLQHVVDAARQIPGADLVVLAVPEPDAEDIIDALPAAEVFAYSASPTRTETDVLGRFLAAAEHYRADVIMRVTGDCPCLDPEVAQRVLDVFHEEHADFATNDVRESGYPDGQDVEVFSRALLERAHAEATSAHDREHVTAWMHSAAGVKIALVRKPGATGPSPLKLSIDSPEDLHVVSEYLATRSQPMIPPKKRSK